MITKSEEERVEPIDAFDFDMCDVDLDKLEQDAIAKRRMFTG